MNIEQKNQEQEYKFGYTFQLSSISSDLNWNDFTGTELSDYEFKYWTADKDGLGEPIYDGANVTYNTVSNDLYAQWEKTWFKFTYDKNFSSGFSLSVTTNSNGWGKVNEHEMSVLSPLICTDIQYGQVISLSAVGYYGYSFHHWGWGETLSVIDITITADTLKNVSFYPNEHVLTLVSVPEEGGTAEGPDVVKYMQKELISAYANDGFTFSEWKSDNNVDIAREYPYGLSVSRIYLKEDNDITISALFIQS